MTPSLSNLNPELHAELGRHADFLRSLAQRLVRHDADAEDLVQDTLTVALKSGPQDPSRLRPWLATVLGRQSRNHFRREAYRRNAAGELDLDDRPAPSQPCAAATVDFSKRLLSMVEGLGEPYTETFVMRFYEGLGPKVIAKRMGVPVSTVQSRLARGLERLRSQLDREHDGGREAWLSAAAGLAGSGPSLASVPAVKSSLGLGILKVGAVAAMVFGALLILKPWASPGAQIVKGLTTAPSATSTPAPELASADPSTVSGARVPGALEPTMVITAAETQPEILTIIGSVSDLELDGAPGSGMRVGPGVRVEYNAYHGDREENGASVATASSGTGLPFVETDADGGFRLEIERDGLTVLQIWAERTPVLRRAEWTMDRSDVPSGEFAVDLQRYPHGTLAGTVVDTAGQPVPDFQLALPREEEPATIATTGSDGRFVFTNVVSEVNIRPVDEHYTYATDPLSAMRSRGGWEDLNLIVSVQGRLTIRCLDAEGEPAPRCSVFTVLSPAEPTGNVFAKDTFPPIGRLTDNDGVVVLGYIPVGLKLLVGSSTLGVQCFGMRTTGDNRGVGTEAEDDQGATAIVVPATGELEVTLRAKRSFRVEGLVTDPQGEPVAGIWVTIQRPGVTTPMSRSAQALVLVQVQTDATGRYDACFHAPMDAELVVVRAGATVSDHGAPGASAQLQLAGPKSTTVDLQLLPRHQLSGRVLDAAEAPVVDALVIARLHHADGRLLSTEPLLATSREDGSIGPMWLEAAPLGAELRVTVSHDSYRPIELRLAPSACANLDLGFVEEVDAQVTIRLEPTPAELDQIRVGWGTLSPGHVEPTSLPPLAVAMGLQAEHPRKFPRFAGEPRLDLDLLHLCSVQTFSVSEAPYTISLPSGAGWIAVTGVGVDGEAMTIRATELCAISPGEHEIRVQLVPTAELVGRVMPAEGTEPGVSEPLCYSVRTADGLLERPVGWSRASTSVFHLAASGRFRVMHIPTGNHELLIGTRAELLADSPRRIEPFTLEPGDNVGLTIDL